MKLRKLIVREILHNKLSFVAAFLAVVVAAGVLTAELTVLSAHDIVTGHILAVKEQIKDRLKGVIFNRVPESKLDYANKLVKPFMESHGINVYGIIRNDPVLGAVPIADLVEELGGTVLIGEDKTDELVERFMIGAMNVSSALKHFRKARNKAVITGGDRADIQLAALETPTKTLILTGGMYPGSSVISAAQSKNVPIMVVADDTMTVVSKMDSAVSKVSVRGKRIEESISTFQKFIDKTYLDNLVKR